MPTLNWIGKEAVMTHHQQVPFHLLKDVPSLACGEPGNGNLIVQGDNLVALKALLPYYAGQVKCIYIDPPYNTGNEDWVYNDNVNSPIIREWLGEVVGKEGEMLDRHDRWLCMMYPRLALLHRFLNEDGAIFISIDDGESHRLRFLMDEIFGASNFVANVVWQKRYVSNVTAKFLSDMHDHILVYAKRLERFSVSKIPRTAEQEADYKNPDNDPRGDWRAQDLSASKPYSAGLFPIEGPNGEVFNPPPKRYWRMNKEQYDKWLAEGRITFGKSGKGRPMLKRFLSETQAGLTPNTWWNHEFAGHNKEATLELKDLFAGDPPFDTPKPTRLLERILQVATSPGDLILDSFAGSGTTGHAVLKMNHATPDKEPRCFILIEEKPSIAREVTAERVRRAAEGYANARGQRIAGLGSGFRFCELGEPLFDDDGKICESVSFANLARHVYFTETGEPLPSERVLDSPFLGACRGLGIYLLYNGILRDKSANGGNVLTRAVLAQLPPFDGQRVVYCAGSLLGRARLQAERIIVRQTPYEIKSS
jgi:adenine-specific DNA-methyltransferase